MERGIQHDIQPGQLIRSTASIGMEDPNRKRLGRGGPLLPRGTLFRIEAVYQFAGLPVIDIATLDDKFRRTFIGPEWFVLLSPLEVLARES